MLKECDIGVVLIGSADKNDARNPFSLEQRKKMIEDVFRGEQRLVIGSNIDLQDPFADDAQWDILLGSCVMSLTGRLPDVIYAADDYTVEWKRVTATVKKYPRFGDVRGTVIRELIRADRESDVRNMVPPEVIASITH